MHVLGFVLRSSEGLTLFLGLASWAACSQCSIYCRSWRPMH